MLTKFSNIVWIISSMSFYYLFFLISKFDAYKSDSDKYKNIHNIELILLIGLMLLIIIPLLILYIKKGNETIKINTVEPSEFKYVFTYLSMFVIALSIKTYEVFIIIGIIIMFLLFRIRYIYFNPILLLLGYRFYDIKTSNSKIILYICKESNLYESPDISGAYRLNNDVFISINKKRD